MGRSPVASPGHRSDRDSRSYGGNRPRRPRHPRPKMVRAWQPYPVTDGLARLDPILPGGPDGGMLPAGFPDERADHAKERFQVVAREIGTLMEATKRREPRPGAER